MPRPTPSHVRMNLRGTLGAAGLTPERWENVLNLSNWTTPFQAGIAPTVQLEDLRDDCEDWINGATGFTAAVRLTEVRFSQIGSNGVQDGATVILPATAQGSAGAAGPWQDSVVCSLVADGRGKGFRGRIFLAPVGGNISQDDGLITEARQNAIADGCLDFINAINNHPTLDTGGIMDLVIVGSTGSSGTLRRVDRIRVGRVVDTHRSRRRSLPELYTERAVSA